MKQLIVLAAFLLCSFTTIYSQAWLDKIDLLLIEKLENEEQVDFLVVLTDQQDLSLAKSLPTKNDKAQFVFTALQNKASQSQQSIKTYLDAQSITYESLFIVNLLKLKGDLTLIKTLAERGDVSRIMDNPSVAFSEPIREVTPAGKTLEWGLEQIGVDQVWQLGYRGSGVVVGGQDTGYEWTHPAIVNSYRGNTNTGVDHNYNWHDAIHEISPLHNDSIPDPSLNPCGLDVDYPCDDHNHGTHTMGTMVGLDGDNEI